ncbi:amidohydrolase family protein [Streptosporangium amethystogenes]|uniref:amidohydrolase family protein n=1 Tax=Streptosporangium amethystogenes TaxID=2002 RepID=UPI0007C829D8|nr:amidohydrolase family protein [Streptosporangium amethystogenes]
MRSDGVLPVELPDAVREALLAPLVDQNCHGVRRDDLTRARFETLLSDAGTPAPPGTTHFDTPVGTAVRRWCAPVLGLAPHVPPAVYLARRAELGATEVNRRLLGAAGIATFLFDGDLGGPEVLPPAEMGHAGGAGTARVVHIERAEEEVARAAVSGVSYISALAQSLAARAVRAVALKSVTAHRSGLHLDPARPSRGAVIAAATRRLACPGGRLADQVLLRHLLWTAVDVAREYGRPLQFHTGHTRYGGAHAGRGGRAVHGGRVDVGTLGTPDAAEGRALPGRYGAGPAPMTGFIVAVQPVGVPVVLLHCHPFHRRAAYLAGALPNVYVDVGAALTRSATGSAAVMAELLELAPFHKQLFGSGGHGVAETCHLGALHYRRGLAGALAARLADGEWSVSDAVRVAQMIGSGNARRIYRL